MDQPARRDRRAARGARHDRGRVAGNDAPRSRSRAVGGSLRRHYAAGVIGAVGLVLVSALAARADGGVAARRRDGRRDADVLGDRRAARRDACCRAHAAAQITRLGERLGRLRCRSRRASRCPRPARASWPTWRSPRTRWRATSAASDRARRELVAAVSHDLRTPIASLGCSSTPSPTASSRRPRRSPTTRRGCACHLAHLRELVDDLFELARIDAGDVAWERCAGGRRRAGRGDGRGVPAGRRERSVTLAERVEAALPPVAASPERLQRVLFNLLENAVAHAPVGGSVTLTRRPRERRRAVRDRRHRRGHRDRGRAARVRPLLPRRRRTPRGRSAAPGSGSRSPARSSRRTAAGSGSRTPASPVRGWHSRCLYILRHDR